jgi:hypothetical protein
MYTMVWVFTVVFEMFAATVVTFAVVVDKEKPAAFEALCKTADKEQLLILAINKFVALLITAFCCMTEATALSDIFAKGVFIHKTWTSRFYLSLQTFIHGCSVTLVYYATTQLEFYETSTTDIYLNCVALLFIFQMKQVVAQTVKMRLIQGELELANFTALTDGIAAAAPDVGAQKLQKSVLQAAGSTVRRKIHGAKLAARRATWAFEGDTEEEQEAGAISWFIRLVVLVVMLIDSFRIAEDTASCHMH